MEFIGSVQDITKADKAYVVYFNQTKDTIQVIAHNIKNRNGVLEPDRIMFEVLDSPSIVYRRSTGLGYSKL